MQSILLYIGSGLTVVWGISHLMPTKGVVAGFGDISEDNRNIIRMEWIVEGVSLIFIGILAAAVTFIDPNTVVSQLVYILTTIVLLVLALVSLFTGCRVRFLPFRLCPFILTASAVLILAGRLV